MTVSQVPAFPQTMKHLMARTYRISDEERRKRSERLKRLHADPEFGAMRAESGRKQIKKLVKKLRADPKFRDAASKRMKELRADPEFAVKQVAAMKQLHADPSFATTNAARARETMKRLHADPDFRAAASKRMKQRHVERKLKRSLSSSESLPEPPKNDPFPNGR